MAGLEKHGIVYGDVYYLFWLYQLKKVDTEKFFRLHWQGRFHRLSRHVSEKNINFVFVHSKYTMGKRGLSQELIVKLYVENVERFTAIAFRYLGDKEKARDIVSECYEYIIKRKEFLTGGINEIKTYLFLMVKSRCLNEIRLDAARKERLKNLYEADILRLSDDNVSRKMIEWDIRKVLEKAETKMPKRAFDIYVSSRFGDMSHKELAKLYGVPQSRVAKDISKANKIVKMIIKDYLHILILLPHICIFVIGGGNF